MSDTLDLGHVPFYWRVKSSPNELPNDIPQCLPFAFDLNSQLQLITQKRNPVVLKWLEYVYTQSYNVGYLQEGHDLADSYGGEFIEFFKRASSHLNQAPKSAIDIGCGGTYLLRAVRDLGLSVKGIDPSPITVAAGNKAGIEILPYFYPSVHLTESSDVIFHYDVLEHVEDPVSFLKSHHDHISSSGCIIFAVPDCTQHIALGDASMLLHEHLNYFDTDSLTRTVEYADFKIVLIERSTHGGVLMCCAVPANSSTSNPTALASDSKFTTFKQRALQSLNNFDALLERLDGLPLGIYVPLRAFPYLSMSKTKTPNLRFFDDNSGLHGCYYDGFDIEVENREQLLSNPPNRILICSLAFGKKISDSLNLSLRDSVEIILWRDLFPST